MAEGDVYLVLPPKPDDLPIAEIDVPVKGYRDGVLVWAAMMKCRFDPRRIRRIKNIRPVDRTGCGNRKS